MSNEIRDKLRSDILAVGWDDLAPHFARGGLVIAAPTLDLLDAAEAIARDQLDRVQGWLQAGDLRRATDADATAWAEEHPRFQFVILQPWVLAQVIPSDR